MAMANPDTEAPLVERTQAFVVPRVSDLMSWPPRTVTTGSTLDSARHLLLDAGISGVPVVDHEGHPIGMLSKTDLLRASEGGAELEELVEGSDASQRLGYEARLARVGAARVDEIMTRHVVTVSQAASVVEVAKRMADERVHRVLVVDDRARPRGVLSSFDVLEWLGNA